MKIKHVFFDLDHTLWDFEKNSDLAFLEIFEKNKVHVPITDFLMAYKPLNREFWRLYREEKISKKELRYRRLKQTFDAVNFEVSDDLIDILAVEYIQALPLNNFLFEGTFEILEYLQPKYDLHIITNGFEEIQSKKMKSSKISGYFKNVITSESVGVKKPNPLVFEHALKVANATKENSIMIGDSIEADIYGAINSGIQAIHCDFENENIKNEDFVSVTSLLELKQYL